MRTIHTAILHCAAVPSGWYLNRTAVQMVAEVRRWHLERGFNDIGYHYLIAPSGSVAVGRPLNKEGAHVAGHNKGTVGILLIETVRITAVKTFDHYFEYNQLLACRALIKGLNVSDVKGHNDYSAKLCPGFSVKAQDWL